MPFAGIRDLWRRCRPSVLELSALHDAGALDRISSLRTSGERAWIVSTVAHEPHGRIDEPDQLRFDFAPDSSDDPGPPPHPQPLVQRQRDRRAWDVLGCLPRAHPFALWDLPERQVRCADIGVHLDRRTVSVLVWVITRKQVEAVQERNRDGTPLPEPLVRPMAFVTLEDETGLIESTWFPEPYRACGPLIEEGRPFWVQGRIVSDHGVAMMEVASGWAAVR
jgi:DNA polymerase-3 subunit alpha/error-prone DNA polymerase